MLDKAIMDDIISKNPAKGVKVVSKEDYTRRVLSKSDYYSNIENEKDLVIENGFKKR